MTEPLPPDAVIAHCRAGFEPEAVADLARLAAEAGAEIVVDAPTGRGFVVARPTSFDPHRWLPAFHRAPPIFARSVFVGAGPHPLLDSAAAQRRPDRIAPLAELIWRFCAGMAPADLLPTARRSMSDASLRLETADTNDGKALSGLARSLAARLANALRESGMSIAEHGAAATAASPAATAASPAATGASPAGTTTTLHLHVLLTDGAHAFVGASAAPWASRWPMGIPRLRMPGGAPSRSTLKLAEAFVTFLGDREHDLLRPGMRAVDLGAAPGGWTWQLAHRGLRVIAVDNGPLKGAVRDDPLVTHLRADGLAYLPRRPVDWMTCDIVEQPARIAALAARWIGEGRARNAIFNLKLPMKKRYAEVRRCESIIVEALAKARVDGTLTLRQLYHDREEVTGYLARASGAGVGRPPADRRIKRPPR